MRREQRDVIASYKLVARGTPANMTDVQKSVWVEPGIGYIDEEQVTIIEIPSALKPEILSHLRVVYGIEASTVYNDLSGFIRDQVRLRDPDAEWHAGVRAWEAGRHERALGFFARYEELVAAPRVICSTAARSRTGTPNGETKPFLTWRHFGAVPLAILGRSRKRWSPRTRNASTATRGIASDGPTRMRGLPQRRCSPDSGFGWSVMPVRHSEPDSGSLTSPGPGANSRWTRRRPS